MHYQFDKKRRLLNKKDYDAVFSNAYRIKNNEFIILFCRNQLGYARLGLALSKKVIPKAHHRNRMKRILRESFRLKPQLPDLDIVVLARPFVYQALPHQIRANLGELWDTLSKQYAI